MGDALEDKAPMSSVPQGAETYPGGPHTPFPDQTEFQKDPMNSDDPAQSTALGLGKTVFTNNPALACPLGVQIQSLLFLRVGVDTCIYFQANPGQVNGGRASERAWSPGPNAWLPAWAAHGSCWEKALDFIFWVTDSSRSWLCCPEVQKLHSVILPVWDFQP